MQGARPSGASSAPTSPAPCSSRSARAASSGSPPVRTTTPQFTHHDHIPTPTSLPLPSHTALPLFVTLISLAIDEARQAAASVDYRASLRVAKDQAGLLWSAITQPAIYLPLIFLVLWQGSPSSDSAFFYFLTNELKLTPEFLGRVRLATSVASLGGVWLYQRFLRETPIAKILLWTTIASVPLGLTQLILIYHLNTALGIPDEAFMFGDSVVLTGRGGGDGGMGGGVELNWVYLETVELTRAHFPVNVTQFLARLGFYPR